MRDYLRPEWCVTYRYAGAQETVRVWVLAESREQAIENADELLPEGRFEFVEAEQTAEA
ncbi:TPA: hypothetical protein QDB44_000888 [Burkholderia vietnamiensis]|nr:hypothetical protein [Burkholderia vietnamiensis]